MPQMCKFVYDFYAKKVALLADITKPVKLPSLEDTKVGEVKSEHKPSQHPGDDRDSDDEMEGKAKVFKPIVNEVDK